MMVRFGLLAVPLVVGAIPAMAQDDPRPAAAPTVQGYLCTFAGKCDGTADEPAVTRDAPETKGFRLARPVEVKEAATAAGPVRTGAAATAKAKAGRDKAGSRNWTPAKSSTYRPGPSRAYTAAQSAGYTGGGMPRANLFIGFKLNSAELSADGLNSAQIFARAMQMPELRSKHFLIEGHTDLRGGNAINGPLSARRAQAVTRYLVSLGVDRSRLESRGFGASVPLPGRRDTDPVNRRVEATLLP